MDILQNLARPTSQNLRLLSNFSLATDLFAKFSKMPSNVALSNGYSVHTNGHTEYKKAPKITEKAFEDGELLQKVYEATEKAKIVTGIEFPTKVLEFRHPHQLQKIFDLKLKSEGLNSLEEVEDIIEKVVKYSVKTTHPHFFNQLYSGVDEVGLAGSWLSESLNTNIHTYECAPVFVIMEHHMIQELTSLFGWEEGDGVFSPGGSLSNMYGISLAKHKKYPDLKQEGLFGKTPLAILTSDMSHYSMQKAAGWMGYGVNQVYAVKSDSRGKMRGEALRSSIRQARSEGKEPFFVNATAGTTVFGAFDPLDEIADVCQEEGLWLHVDACWGGGVVLSTTKKALLKGIERVDSIAWNPHKMTGAPLQCSPFLVKHKGLLKESNCLGATYLFQPDKCYDVSYDTGDKSVQCGRKADAFKLWLMFKVRGLGEFGDQVDNAFVVARYLEETLKTRPGFRLVLDKHECTNVCFWYIPPSLRGLEETHEWRQKLHKVAPTIKKRILEAGTLQVGYQPVGSKNLVNFFRMVITGTPRRTKEHMDHVISEIEKAGQDL